MVKRGIRKTEGGGRARKPAGRRARGVQTIERDGHWHAIGTMRAGGRSIRVRQSLNLAVEHYSRDQAEEIAQELTDEIRARATGKVGRGAPLSVAADDYLEQPRARPLRPSSIRIIKRIAAKFRTRHLNEIRADEWVTWIDGDRGRGEAGMFAGLASSSRERFLNTVVAFLHFAKLKHGLAALPEFSRDRAATNPSRRTRRRVEELRPDLIGLLFEHAHITIRAQLAVECDTGARVSSVLHGVRLCDLSLAPGRELIIFRETKNGLDVSAMLGPASIAILKDYLQWRGRLHEREAPLFLTPKRQPYADNGGTYGSQNKTGFNNAKARAQRAARDRGAAAARAARGRGDQAGAHQAVDQAKADALLLGRVTQHWFRHRLATLWLRRDPRAAMEQGGWLDIRSLMGYASDVPEFRRQLAGEMDLSAALPRKAAP